ncbi:MAG TPA: cobalamin-dependent protein [Euzebya sp.]|nr:cobalamin-dependent protein [Euzebya sp.]
MTPTDPAAATSLQADLILLHAPSVYDFRDRDDVLFAYLSDSDSVNVTSIYEMFPIGFFSLQQRLRETDMTCEIVNLASLMLQHPELDVPKLLGHLEAPVFGFDLHWMTQCHGAVELARILKAIHPDSVIIFGGISATYYAEELAAYPGVDAVVQGYDTLEPTARLVARVRRGNRDLRGIPNLVFADADGVIQRTGFDHKPMRDYNDASVDWGFYEQVQPAFGAGKMIMTLPNTGCAFDCPWCGGSKYSYDSIMGASKPLIQKDLRHIESELRSLGEAARHTSIYALQCYSEGRARMERYLHVVQEMGYKQVYFEQFHLTPEPVLHKMAEATEAFIMLSPESHDPVVSKLAGRGTYTMPEMEAWIDKALDIGIAGVMVWFFIGMPKQDPTSVMDTVAYAQRLLARYPDGRVTPLVCPMVPFLDPGSRFFEQPDAHGYRIFHRTLEEHRQAMVNPLWHRRLNYETEWLSRRQIQDVTYQSIRTLVSAKAGTGHLPQGLARSVIDMIDMTEVLLADIEGAIAIDGTVPASLRADIAGYNRTILSYSSDQIVPMQRPFGGRWFDDFTVPDAMIRRCLPMSATRP